MPFDEVSVLEENQHFLLENMPVVKHVKIIAQEDVSAIESIEGAKVVAAAAVPGEPSCMFIGSDATYIEESQGPPVKTIAETT